ncbi:MAG: flagellar hook-associated protein FlgK [Proteobacteria bacterium]|nr:flagellar hook-associated protein FlgK [Pseudomonadota bacterium]
MSLFGSFEIGKKGLTASQMGQSTTGHNIANVDTEGFSRQEIIQESARPMSDGKGTGVDVTGVRRIQDGFTKQKVIDEQTNVSTWETRQMLLTEAEVMYTDLEGTRLRGAMDEFWGAWSSVATEPEIGPHRKALVTKGQKLAEDFRMFHRRLIEFNQTLNGRIRAEMLDINQITREIALLNKQVEQLENKGIPANDARDKREVLLQKLSGKVELRWFEGPHGTLEIQVPNGQHLVHGRHNYELIPYEIAEEKDNIRIGLINPPGIKADVTDIIKTGALKEMVNQRDFNIKKYLSNLDALAKEITFRVNTLHASGTGINGIKSDETGAYRFDEEELANPLAQLKSGDFQLKLLGENSEIEEVITVNVAAGIDTIGSIVEKINRAAGAYETLQDGREVLKDANKLKAFVNNDGSVSITSGLGKHFIFGPDETNVMATLGFNCFFHLNEDSGDMVVSQELIDDEMKIVAGSDMIPGDNRIATEIANLQLQATMNDDTVSFDEFYNSQITEIGLNVQDAQRGLKAHTQMLDQYKALRDSVSSVNLDEEMTKMVKYQRAYESSAKFMGTVDQMTQTLVNM